MANYTLREDFPTREAREDFVTRYGSFYLDAVSGESIIEIAEDDLLGQSAATQAFAYAHERKLTIYSEPDFRYTSPTAVVPTGQETSVSLSFEFKFSLKIHRPRVGENLRHSGAMAGVGALAAVSCGLGAYYLEKYGNFIEKDVASIFLGTLATFAVADEKIGRYLKRIGCRNPGRHDRTDSIEDKAEERAPFED